MSEFLFQHDVAGDYAEQRFTDKGMIVAGCKFDENKKLLFQVSDTGIGIPQDKQNVLFERFVEIDQGSNSNIKGTGSVVGTALIRTLEVLAE